MGKNTSSNSANNTANNSDANLMAELQRLRAENEALKAQKNAARTLTLKVSEKGGLSAYGLGRWPVTLYVEQWEFLLANVSKIKDFIAAHRGELTTKQ